MLLSVLIPTITERKPQFDRLFNELSEQSKGEIVVKFCCDDKQMSIGAKRQLLLNSCETPYFVMVDDDDSLAPNYFDLILPELEKNPDCVCYLERVMINGIKRIACHSNNFDTWADFKHGYDYIRTPFYKDVLKTDIAKQVGFKDMRYGEDHDFSIRLKASRLIKNEIFIDQELYYYTAQTLTQQQHNQRYGIN